ncbi:MAG: 4-hydroxy-3-methylbut-2-enyl diphosphate reductase [Bacteroidales bacterium]|nr:4-hydroxy-3-methylbut-2-enyl diphosphate reductase [Bacteroidales bacterium]
MDIIIDPKAGFCSGVKRTVKLTERALKRSNYVYSVGQLLHNENEMNRLVVMGLLSSKIDTLPENESLVIFRAHGEPPRSYGIVRRYGHELIDATCPIVSKLQRNIREEYKQISTLGGTLIIYGKKNHPEIIGLVGQCGSDAIVIEHPDDIDGVEFRLPVAIYTQTTADLEGYKVLTDKIKRQIGDTKTENNNFRPNNTICNQVINRIESLTTLAAECDIIIFVGGKNSSNGKYLFSISLEHNQRSFMISDKTEIKKCWFDNTRKIGISGATSTPHWQLKEVAGYIKEMDLLKNWNE